MLQQFNEIGAVSLEELFRIFLDRVIGLQFQHLFSFLFVLLFLFSFIQFSSSLSLCIFVSMVNWLLFLFMAKASPPPPTPFFVANFNLYVHFNLRLRTFCLSTLISLQALVSCSLSLSPCRSNFFPLCIIYFQCRSVKTFTYESLNNVVRLINGLSALLLTLLPGKGSVLEGLHGWELRPTFRGPRFPRWMEKYVY